MTFDSLTIALAPAAAAAYGPGPPWFVNAAGTSVVYRSTVLGRPCYAYQGTRTWRQWIVDFMATDVAWHPHPVFGPVHEGFWLEIQASLAAIAADLSAKGWPEYFVTGHSMGGGETRLTHAAMKQIGHPPLASRSYEPPCVGTAGLTAWLADQDHGWTQTYNATGSDLVTQFVDWPEWEHQGALTRLQVPDAYGMARKHGMTAVLAAMS